MTPNHPAAPSWTSQARVPALLTLLSSALVPLTGCLVVGASSNGGFFIWPGSISLLLVLLVVFFLLRRRR